MNAELPHPLEDLDKLRSHVMFLASVIACGEPYTEHVEKAVDEAHACITRLQTPHLAVERSDPNREEQ